MDFDQAIEKTIQKPGHYKIIGANMSQIYPLDYVIRRVDSDDVPLSSSQKLVIVGSKNKKIFPKKPLLQDVRYYLVANTKDARNVAECHGPRVFIKDFDSDRGISIRTYYQASCQPGNEEKVVLALFSNSHPGEELNNLINQWLLDHTRNQEAKFFENYMTEQAKLQKHISDRAFHDVGLDLKVRISLEGEEKLQPIALGPFFVPVRVKDYDEKVLDLKISATLHVDEKNKIKALLRKWVLTDLENFIQEQTKLYVLRQLELEEFYNKLHTGGLRKNLVAALNPALIDLAGYKFEHFSVEYGIAAAPVIQDFFELEQEIECKVQEYPNPVKIKNNLQMILEDIGKYKACQSPRLNTWAKENLERIIHESLFDARYIDLLIDFQRREHEIKMRMSERAKAIGYKIKYLLTVPDIVHRKLKETFLIETEGAFATKFSNVYVKLQIVVTARINDLKSIEKHLNRQEDIIALMRESLLDEARQYLHTIDPETFYMDFHNSRIEGEPSVERRLIDLVSSRLAKNFGAEVISVIPKVIDTELMERFRGLQKQLCSFELEVKSLHSGEPVKFTGKFQIDGVDKNGWHKFQLREYSLAEIKAHVEENVRGVLATQMSSILKYNSIEHLMKLTKEIDDFARNKVSDAYGLVISVTNLYRERTTKEDKISEVDERSDMDDIAELEAGLDLRMRDRISELEKDTIIKSAEKEQLKELQEKRKKLLLLDDSDDAIEELDEKSKKLKGKQYAASKQQIGKKLKQLKQQMQQPSPKKLNIGGSSNLLDSGNTQSNSKSNQEKGQQDE